MEEPDRLQSMGSQRVGHDFTFHCSLSLFTLTLEIIIKQYQFNWETKIRLTLGEHG